MGYRHIIPGFCAAAALILTAGLPGHRAIAAVASVTAAPTPAANSIETLKPEAERGNAMAQWQLGGAYISGKDVPRNEAEAAKWIESAAEAGIVAAQDVLGEMYRAGQGVKKDAGKAANWFRLAAEAGAQHAQFALGLAYQNGDGVTRDYPQALQWYRMAAAQGLPGAMNNLGVLYDKGLGGAGQNVVYALMWFEVAAKTAGRDNATLQRANISAIRRRMKPDQIKRAEDMEVHCVETKFAECGDTIPPALVNFIALRAAAAGGDANAKFQLAQIFDSGQIRSKRDGEAYELYLQAASAGVAGAYFPLGQFYSDGRAVPRSDELAARAWLAGAREGVPEAQAALGVSLFDGKGAPKDNVRAFMWLDAAASSSSAGATASTAARLRDTVASQLSPADLAQAKAMSDGCRSLNYKSCNGL